MKTKNMKVYEGTGTSDMTIPKIVLQGKWLRGFGFSVGDQIIVTCSEGKITIMRPDDSQDGKSMELKESFCAE